MTTFIVRSFAMVQRVVAVLFPPLFYLLLAARLLREALWDGSLIFGDDVIVQSYAFQTYAADVYRQYRIPLWNPYMGSGLPFLGTVHPILYPLNLLFLLPTSVAFTYTYLIHLFVAGYFTFRLAHALGQKRMAALFSGAAFMLSGAMALRIYAGHFSYVWVYAWIPVVFFLAERVRTRHDLFSVMALGVALALQIFIQVYQIVYCELLTLPFYFLILGAWRTRQRWLKTIWHFIQLPLLGAAVVVFVVFCSAATVLPIVDMQSSSVRQGGLSLQSAEFLSAPPLHLLTFLSPNFFGVEAQVSYWGASYYHEAATYVGGLTLLLALLGLFRIRQRYPIFFALMAIAAAWLAFGSFDTAYSYLFERLPGWRLFRVPPRTLVFAVFALAMLAGAGLDGLMRWMRVRNDGTTRISTRIARKGCLPFRVIRGIRVVPSFILHPLFIALVGGWLVLVAWWFSIFLENSPQYQAIEDFLRPYLNVKEVYPDYVPGVTVHWSAGLWRDGWMWVFTTGAALAALIWCVSYRKPRAFGLMLTLLVAFDLWTFSSQYIIPVSADDYLDSASRIARQLRAMDSRPLRIYSTSKAFRMDYAMMYGIGDVESAAGLSPYNYFEFLNPQSILSNTDFPQSLRRALIIEPPTYAKMDLLNVAYFVSDNPIHLQDYPLAFELDYRAFEWDQSVRTAFVFRNPHPAPRAFVVRAVRVMPSADEILPVLASDEFDPMKELIVEDEAAHSYLSGSRGLRAETNGEADAVRLVREDSDGYELVANLATPGIVVASYNFVPQFEAYVDGVRVPLWRADYALHAIPVGAGLHHVRVVFHDAAFETGMKLGAIGGILVLVVLIRHDLLMRREKKKRMLKQQEKLERALVKEGRFM